jgi:plasmid replication initiation protein
MENQKKLLIANKLCSSVKDLTSEQYKLFYNVLHKFRWLLDEDNSQNSIELLQYELVDMLGKKKLRFKQIKDIVKSMPHDFTVFNSDVEEMIFVFEKITMKDIDVDGFNAIIFYFSKSLKIHLVDLLKRFSSIDLEEIKLLKSKYSYRMYELCSQLANQTRYLMPYKQLLIYFDLPNMYTSSDVNKILEKSKKEINEKTKYLVEIVKIKKSRRITHYNFFIDFNCKQQKDVKKFSNIIKIDSNPIEKNLNDFFEDLWQLYPMKKNKADIKHQDILILYKYGYEVMKKCINRYIEFIEEKKKEGFPQSYQHGNRFFTTGYIDYLDENYTTYKAQLNNNNQNNVKPIQSTNFEQRKYDDEFFESLYDNFKE